MNAIIQPVQIIARENNFVGFPRYIRGVITAVTRSIEIATSA